jgi:hypothetical protein
MVSVRRIVRGLTAVLTAVGAVCGLVVAGAGLAQAAVPNAWGFALVESPSGPVVATHWAESVPSPVPVAIPGAPGQVTVRFRGIGFFKGGVVHATAVTGQFAWCQAQRWRPLGGAELVTVRCYRKGGVPAFVPFTVSFAESSGTLPGGLAYAYLYDTGAGVATSFNSKGLPNTVTPMGPGVWRARLPGPGPATASGGVQVTAVNAAAPAICDVGGQAGTTTAQIVIVRCYSAGGKPHASGWTLSYQRGRAITGAKPSHFAYTVNNKPLAGLYVPMPPAVNFNSAGGTNTILSGGSAFALVRFPLVGFLPNTVLVTAFSPVARICNLNTVWATFGGNTTVRDVVCYQPSGAMAPNTKSFTTYTSK